MEPVPKLIAAAYPEDGTTAEDLLKLACAYHKAAELLLSLKKNGKPETIAPFRRAAIHAIELYFNALLLRHGSTAAQVRDMRHDLVKRLAAAEGRGLALKPKTARHIEAMVEVREYSATRYSSKTNARASPINRLEATLKEVSAQVAAMLKVRA
jgi:hypothetical protein